MNLQPLVSDIADIFTWKTVNTIASNNPVASANHASDQIKIQGNSFFCFVGWRGSTNYDGIAGQFNIANPVAWQLVSPAVVPNNFHAFVRRNNRFNMMDQPMAQGALCSTGYRAGMQVPWPVLYPPNTVFNIDLYNTAATLLTETDRTTVIPMRIDFGMFGYNVPAANIRTFLNCWEEFYGVAVAELTGVTLPRLG